MRRIYHLVAAARWDSPPEGAYWPGSLASEGFVHCSYAEQVSWAANTFYAAESDLLVLAIDPARLSSPVKEEAAGNGERFPHIYGPIACGAIEAVYRLHRDAHGRWLFPENSNLL